MSNPTYNRQTQLQALREKTVDVLIVGAGINGAVTAAALSAHGLSVAIVDRSDFANQTSSQSSNLVWGGIKYLETHEYGLVNKLCKSRNRLMDAYPSTVKEIRFLTTLQKGFRFLLTAKGIKKRAEAVKIENSIGGTEYSDCYLYDNDSRFVFNFIRKANTHGAITLNYVEATHTEFNDGLWQTDLSDTENHEQLTVKSRCLINACGPWADSINQLSQIDTTHHHLFSKGVHLTVRKLSDNNKVLAFFASDGRLFFVIPMGPVTCLGTTDTQVKDPEVNVSEEDRRFILDNANQLLSLDQPLTHDDIIAERCGVRPLAAMANDQKADWVKLSRKHAVDSNPAKNHISIFGGKITDCLNIGEELVNAVKALGLKPNQPNTPWYGEPDLDTKNRFLARAKQINLDAFTDPSSPEPLSTRLWRRYANDALNMLDEIEKDASQAELIIENAEYIRCELSHAKNHEMIVKLSDFLRRRSKISMVVKHKTLTEDNGLTEACKVLFGSEWQHKLDEYLANQN